MNWDMLKRRLAWAKMRTYILKGELIEFPVMADMLAPVATSSDEQEPTVVLDPPLKALEEQMEAMGERIAAKWPLASLPRQKPFPHTHVMTMELSSTQIVFKQSKEIGINWCQFQYRGVNLCTDFVWDGTEAQYHMAKAQHIEDTIKFLAEHGITATKGPHV